MYSWEPLLAFFNNIFLLTILAASLFSKLRGVGAFVQTVESFAIVPKRFTNASSYATIGIELVAVICLAGALIVSSAALRLAGLWSGLAILIVYTGVLTVLRIRRRRVSCHCFGANQESISGYDIIRNFLIMAGTVAGLLAGQSAGLPLEGTLPIGVAAVATALITINIGDVVEITRKPMTIEWEA
ncbi:MauE/DoxX family redox-associated membrane protein [Nonomuraea sp. B19D2]|uniref:MauE/DoxX family redox-associated membrane protein n=1 Tax=Nonomuraea sp. B19D2 TaxID=3159561 RepID=UPI0032DA1DB3